MASCFFPVCVLLRPYLLASRNTLLNVERDAGIDHGRSAIDGRVHVPIASVRGDLISARLDGGLSLLYGELSRLATIATASFRWSRRYTSAVFPTDNEVMSFRASSSAEAAIIPAINVQSDRVMAPRYRILPNQTDLNRLFLSEVQRDLLLPAASTRAPDGVHELCKAWGKNYHTQPLARKCEALAVSGLAGCGDQIDVIAPVEILKKIFKIPYSRARLSIAVHRVGQTLILNTGPDVDEGETLIRTKKNQAKAKEKSLFLKFAMQSVRAEACDCPVSPNVEDQSPTNTSSKSRSDVLSEVHDDLLGNYDESGWSHTADDLVKKKNSGSTKTLNTGRGHSQQDFEHSDSWSSAGHTTFSGVNLFKKSSIVGEQQKDACAFPNDSGSHKRPTSEGFLRVLFWQLEDIRMLLGSDLLLFSNEKHLAVSLHLWETERQVTPLMWLDAWLDNVMASVPELAICYHHNGIVQGYELLKTDDIFLLKGLSPDGTSFFHPHVVQQNAISVLKFLQENCKQDLGTYWLFKNSGEDLVQLFDLSVISRDHTVSTTKDIKQDSLPSSWSRGKGSCSLPLGILLYRLAHRLSLSQDPLDRCKCANFFKNCLELLGERDHLFVRASAHEHVARLILKCHEELGSLLGPLLLEAKKPDDSISEQVLTNSASFPQSNVSDTQKMQSSKPDVTSEFCSNSDTSEMTSGETQEIMVGQERVKQCSTAGTTMEQEFAQSCSLENPRLELGAEASPIVQEPSDVHATSLPSNLTVVASVQARLTAVHHVSQAIKALRWQRQLQDVESKVLTSESQVLGINHHIHVVPVCVQGELDLIEYFDIRECEIGPFMDSKLLQLVSLLGESYLALGLAYKADGELSQALKATELACSVYGSVPQHFRHNIRCTSSSKKAGWVPVPTSQPAVGPTCRSSTASHSFCQPLSQDSDQERHASFWSQAWVLVGDIYVEYQKFGVNSLSEKRTQRSTELSMAEEVVKEVKRLRKKLGQGRKGCSICSLTNCSCENDRANSNTSASSSSSCGTTSGRTRRQLKKVNPQVADKGYTRRTQQEQLATYDSSLLDFDSSKGSSDVLSLPSRAKQACSSASDRKAHNNLKSVELESGSSQVDSPEHVPTSTDDDLKYRTKGDIFSYIKCPKDVIREKNLLAALDCYDAAILALTEQSERSEDVKSVMRKKGWTYNEIGRMKLACGNTKAAKVDFENAINSFRGANDQTNVILIYCNMAHGLRGAAESLVSQLDSVKATGFFEHISKNLFDDSLSWYSEALSIYGMAKSGLKLLSDDIENEKTNLCNEVLTQLAHTYLRLGMLLAREDRNGHSAPKVPLKSSNCENRNSQAMHIVGVRMTANDAIREAIALYESLGSLRAQELAFAQYQLACHHKACCLATVKLEERKPNNAILLQQVKRYLSLADRYWLKALRYYRWSTHPDMYLEILMQRSDLNVAVASVSNSFQLLEVALSHLLEARHIQVSQSMGSSESGQQYPKPSEAIYFKFVQRFQNLLKTMLATIHNSQNTSLQSSSKVQTKNPKSMENNQKSEVHRLDAAKLKEMYRLALKSDEMLDLRQMNDILLS
ncbi:hypothetical protein GOP47_0024862 [Adiantum capillus-veneris]|uniref:EDRF1 N-terminal domain-containing protein n=1 Tax=Adiantum capillus-veneris TaxID=13818 RepID=A0A9D4Z4Q3_ADICA|nr:hypothetical protein GOP47_0024862 [Adiantum capillus-veneris]